MRFGVHMDVSYVTPIFHMPATNMSIKTKLNELDVGHIVEHYDIV